MNFEKTIDILSKGCQWIVGVCVFILVVANATKCNAQDSLNVYSISAEWCGNCPKADNVKTFMLSDKLQGQFLKDYGVRSIYDKIVTRDVLVCTGTDNQICISIEVWRGNNIIKVYR